MNTILKDKLREQHGRGAIATVRLVLGDQLNAQHSWFRTRADDTLYLIAEIKEEASYVRHHKQKICAFFLAMQHFAQALAECGHRVLYLTLDDSHNVENFSQLIAWLCEQTGAQRFEYQEPEERRLARALGRLDIDAKCRCVSAEHFFIDKSEFADYIRPAQHNRLEAFYRKLRERFNILMDGKEPLGGAWNYDSENRERLRAADLANIPSPLCFSNDASVVLQRLERHNIKTIGKADRHLLWPVTRRQAIDLLQHFCKQALPGFGRFQDAMTADSEHRWSLYHSRLSFAMNTKMLSPMFVIDHAIKAFKDADGAISLPQIEGFVRQILGWREYVRAVYWQNADDYHQQNALSAKRALPDYFWHGKTKMRCMQHALAQSLDKAYAHHIQRLMITGNFCLLAGIDPNAVDEWYLGIYIDAIEWVELPNTRGMSQWADGGWVATKPYCAGGNYINKMSDYCRQCHYDVKEKTSDNACPFNSLYWHFVARHADKFKNNPRMSMVYRNWEKQAPAQKAAVTRRAKACLSELNAL